MTTYIEYGVTLTDGKKSKLLSAIKKRSALSLRLKHSDLQGPDELMLTQRQITKIKKSMANGTGTVIKISETQIRSLVKHGGNLFTSLIRLGSKLLPYTMKGVSKVTPYAIKGISKVAPALATRAASALGDLGIKKLFGKGITIPEKFFPFLPPIANEFTKAQIDQINKVFKTGGRLVIKPTKTQIEGGFLGTLASIGIPMALSLLPKLFGSGLQVDRGSSSNTRGVYVPPPSTHGEGYPYYPPPFNGNWENTIGMGAKKKSKGKGLLLGKNSPFNDIPIIGSIL